MHKIVVAKWLQRLMELEYRDAVVDLVPNSVDHAQFFAPVRSKQALPTVGFVYSTGSTKGLDVLLPALGILARRIPHLQLISFGSEIPALNSLPEGVQFLYCPPQDKLREIYARCDVWVTASRNEGFNLPAIEAMACRTPIVSTRSGWPEESIKGGWNGMLVDVDDVNALADAIEWVLSQADEAWRALSLHAFETVAESSWDVSAAMFEKALVNAQARASRGEIAARSVSST
jgi:glycosyltransferase involved in cell wall biosynthesis